MNMREELKLWNTAFPILKKYTDRTLFIIVKPFLLGLRLMKSNYGDDYQVYFKILPLWRKEDIDKHRVLILDGLLDEHNWQIFIRDRGHNQLLERAVINVKRRYSNLFKNTVDLNDLMKFIFERRIYFSDLVSPWGHIPIFQIFFAIGLYYNNESIIEYANKLLNWEIKLWRHIKYESRGTYFTQMVNGKWKKYLVSNSIFKVYYSESRIEEIKQKILRDFENREQFLARIEENCKSPKISKLNVTEFIGVNEYKPPKLLWVKAHYTYCFIKELLFLRKCELSRKIKTKLKIYHKL